MLKIIPLSQLRQNRIKSPLLFDIQLQSLQLQMLLIELYRNKIWRYPENTLNREILIKTRLNCPHCKRPFWEISQSISNYLLAKIFL